MPITISLRGRSFNLKSITVEPVMFLYMYMTFTQFLTFQALIYQKICLDNYNESVCEVLNKNHTLKTQEKFVQKHTSTWILYCNLSFAIPSIFAVILLIGPWGDRVGRKIPLIFPVVGALLYSVSNAINSVYIHAPLGYLLIGNVINGFCGGYIGLLMAVHSYIAHISKPEQKIIRIGILQGMSFLASTLGTASSGVMLDRTSYLFVFVTLIVVMAVTLLYILVWVDNIKPESQELGRIDQCQSLFLGAIKDVSLCVYNNRMSKHFWDIAMILVITLLTMITIVGGNDIILVYTRHPPLSWSQTTLGLFKGTEQFLKGVGVLVLLPLAKRRFGMRDTVAIIVGLMSNAAGQVVLGVASSTAVLFIGCIIGILEGFCFSGLRALCSNMVEVHEQAKLFSLVALFESLSTLAATSLYNNVYNATLNLYHGFCFLMGAALVLICIFISVFLHLKLVRNPIEKYRNLQEEVERDEDSLPAINS